MQFIVEVLGITSETKPTSKGTTYVMLDVAFKNLTTGKTEGKKLVPFGNSEAVYKVFKDAKPGNQFTITSEKGEKYWNWTGAVAVAPGSIKGNDVAAKITVPKSTYETPEERAKKQVYIVKQSSLSNAIELLSVGAKSPPSVQTVLDVAQKFTDWVLSSATPPDNEVVDLINMDDDIPQ